jgi:ABC-type uncharacterized transport system permease subunit
MTSISFHVAALLAYIAAAVFYGANLSLKNVAQVKQARVWFIIALLIHTTAIGVFCVTVKQSPFASGLGTFSVASWAVALLFLPIELRGKIPALGALAAPVCGVLLFAGLVRGRSGVNLLPALKTGMTSLHVLLVLTSFALFALAACCATFYVWQYGLLKHPDKRARFRKLPPLDTVDGLAYHLVAFALPLLTLGLALGFVNAAGGAVKGNFMADPHTIISLGAWLVYGIYLVARTLGGWRGQRLNYLLIAGMVVTLALYFVPTTTHKFM